MDFLTIVVVLYIIYLATCVAVVVLTDSDILTFLATKLGKNPGSVYNGKIVWITGASSGIGEALAKEMTRHNAKLVLSARRQVELERVKRLCLEINKSMAEENILVLPFNMCDTTVHDQCLQTVIAHFRKLDVLISNAGRSQRAFWQDVELSVDKDLFDLNVFSLVNLNRIVVKYFLEIGGGQIVVNSSLAGIVGVPFSCSYTGSKHALQGYFKGLRNEVGHKNISVTLLLPGPTVSGFLLQAFTAEAGKKFGKDMLPTDNRMTAERCAFLSVTAMASQIEEVWLGPFPSVAMAYASSYAPFIFSKIEWIMRKRGTFIKFRDGRDTMRDS